MNTEEKAKAYDEALKWMRELYPGLHGATKEDAEHYFPELKESEDEEIRKGLVNFILYKAGHLLDEETEHKFIAYLEKQKEQKSAEWSEEDEEMLNSCISSIEESKENRYAYRENDGDTSYDREISWLKSLPERFNIHPKQEWSEEDEKWINYFYSLLGLACEKDIHGLGQKAIDAKMWLKSLRPHKNSSIMVDADQLLKILPPPSWKPSEEQMDALRASNSYWLGTSNETPRTDLLESLYNDLEKLIAKR